MKNKILAIIGGTVSLFGLGYLIYMILFGDATFFLGPGAESVMTELNVPAIILMEALYATLLTVIFSKWTSIRTFSDGAKAGLIIGLFLGACTSLELFATTTITNTNGILYDAITFAVRFAVAGGVIALFLGKEDS